MTETPERTAMLDALREDLARALGYTVAFDCTHWHVLTPEGYTLGWTVYEERAEGMFSAVIPDWPRNDGDALAVCLEIARAWNGVQVEVQGSACWCCFPRDFRSDEWRFQAEGATPAEALTRLALAALRE